MGFCWLYSRTSFEASHLMEARLSHLQKNVIFVCLLQFPYPFYLVWHKVKNVYCRAWSFLNRSKYSLPFWCEMNVGRGDISYIILKHGLVSYSDTFTIQQGSRSIEPAKCHSYIRTNEG